MGPRRAGSWGVRGRGLQTRKSSECRGRRPGKRTAHISLLNASKLHQLNTQHLYFILCKLYLKKKKKQLNRREAWRSSCVSHGGLKARGSRTPCLRRGRLGSARRAVG